MKVLQQTFVNETINNGTFTSSAIDMESLLTYYFDARWTGASTTGTVKLQQSLDGETWIDISGATSAIAGAGNAQFEKVEVAYRYVRIHVAETNSQNLSIVVKGILKGF